MGLYFFKFWAYVRYFWEHKKSLWHQCLYNGNENYYKQFKRFKRFSFHIFQLYTWLIPINAFFFKKNYFQFDDDSPSTSYEHETATRQILSLTHGTFKDATCCIRDIIPLESWRFLRWFSNFKLMSLHDKCPNTDQQNFHKVTIKNANFFILIVLCLHTHQQKNFTLNN